MPERKTDISICLLGASFNTMNMGVGALTAGTIKCIKHQYPDSRIFLLDYARKGETYNFRLNSREFLIELVNMRFSKKLYLKNNIVFLLAAAFLIRILPDSVKNRVISNNRCLKMLTEADVIASIAGGDSFSDIYGLGRFFYVALPQLLAILMGKRLVLMPQTLGPFKHRLARAVARHIIRNAEVVFSRDYTGINDMRDFLGVKDVPARLRFCYDVGFVLDPTRPEKAELKKVFENTRARPLTVGFNVSGLLMMGGYTGTNMFGLKMDYRELVKDVIDLLIARHGAAVVLIPHVFGGPAHAESDTAACAAIYAELKDRHRDRLFIIRDSYDQHEIKHIIGQCSFFIGSRMHACIAALSQGVPAVAIAYSRKFTGVMESIDMKDMVADPCVMEKDEIMKTIGDAVVKREQTSRALKSMLPQVQRRVMELFRGVRDF